MPRAGAFVDLGRTLIRRSSTLALALRRHGVITRRLWTVLQFAQRAA